MNCFDCAIRGAYRDAIAICVECGAGLCVEHAVSVERWLTRARVINRVERVEPAARIIRCGTCQTAHLARQRSSDGAGSEPLS